MTVTAVEQFAEEIGPLRLPTAYCPYEPTAKQEWFLRLDNFEAFFGGSAGPGKLLNCSTPVPTPEGWTTIGALQLGDEVFGEDGKPCSVEWLSDVDLDPESYRLVFDDGSVVEACADHLWLTFDAKELGALTSRDPAWRTRRRARRPSRAVAVSKKPWVSVTVTERNYRANPAVVLPPPTGTVRTTKEIAATLITPSGRRNHAIPVAAPLQLPEIDLPLDPYVLGVWLGDGNTGSGQITSADPEIIEELEAAGWESRYVPSTKYGWRVVGLTTRLRELGLLGDKRVPDAYLRGSISQRLSLLQGLMDTDGTIDKIGSAEFTSTLERLAVAVHELACSLGQKARIKEDRARLNGVDCGPIWNVTWTPTIPVFRLPRKAARLRLNPRRTGRFRYIVACDPIPPKPMRCIRVSNPSHLFLVGRHMIPTHNSWSLMMAALQFVDVPGYHALLLRPSLTDFEGANGLFGVSHDWLAGTDAFWHGGRREWSFPSGATVRFGYLANMADMGRYFGKAYSFVGWDELTLFDETLYRSMFRVVRQQLDGPIANVPIRIRATSNPGGPGHVWVKTRFVDPASREPDAAYVPARITDNPHLDYDTYVETLSHMSPVDRARLINGDWDVMEEGGHFHRDRFVIVDAADVPPPVRTVRYWDLAATEASQANPDPDYTAGVRLELSADKMFTVRDIRRGRWAAAEVENVVRQTAEEDGRGVDVYIEQEPGASGKTVLAHYKRTVLQGYACHAGLPRGDKEVRARPVAAAVSNGLVRVVRQAGPIITPFLDELQIFPNGAHDDMVDALSGAHTKLTERPAGRMRSHVPRGRIDGGSAYGM